MIVVNTNLNLLARSVLGLFVLTGRQMHPLPYDEREAVVAHEMGHMHHRHTRKRLLLLFVAPFLSHAQVCAIFRRHELEADAFAARRGHAPALARFLSRYPNDCGPAHPPIHERIRALKEIEHGR